MVRAALSALVFVITLVAFHSSAVAWGKRGHAIVCQTASYLAADAPKGDFLKKHSFDLGYYCNVPDFVWKKPETYKAESNNHFMDMEIFARHMKDSKIDKPFEMDRLAFNAAFPQIEDKAGRAWWRVRELNDALSGIAKDLAKTDLPTKERHELQAKWLVHAGAIGHYIGDLAQPLHVTENYDGQMTEQKGIHSHYEEDVVDQLFQGMGPNLEGEVMKAALIRWKKSKDKLAKLSLLELLQSLTEESSKALPAVLKSDKKTSRNDLDKSAKAHRQSVTDRLAAGSVILAEIYRRQVGWTYNGEKFYTFVGEPAFIAPPQAVPTPTPAPK